MPQSANRPSAMRSRRGKYDVAFSSAAVSLYWYQHATLRRRRDWSTNNSSRMKGGASKEACKATLTDGHAPMHRALKTEVRAVNTKASCGSGEKRIFRLYVLDDGISHFRCRSVQNMSSTSCVGLSRSQKLAGAAADVQEENVPCRRAL